MKKWTIVLRSETGGAEAPDYISADTAKEALKLAKKDVRQRWGLSHGWKSVGVREATKGDVEVAEELFKYYGVK